MEPESIFAIATIVIVAAGLLLVAGGCAVLYVAARLELPPCPKCGRGTK